MAREVYFTEDQRWPSKSQRFGWVVGLGAVIFIVFQLNLHHNAPAVAGVVVAVLVLILLAVLTIQQRLVIRIGTTHSGIPGQRAARRFWRRASRAVPVVPEPADEMTIPSIRLVYTSKNPVSALSPGRRGSRLGRRERHIPLTDVESWAADRLPLLPLSRGNTSLYPVGCHRDAVTIALSAGERLTIPTRSQPALLEALSTSRVDAHRQEQAATVRREEL